MTLASLMVRLTAGVSKYSLLLLAADLASRLKVTQVIGISASADPDLWQPGDVCADGIDQLGP